MRLVTNHGRLRPTESQHVEGKHLAGLSKYESPAHEPTPQ
jgi:hypothetical protein